MHIRLNKFLAQAGVSSRRGADKLITQGRVKVNGQVVKSLGCKVDGEKDKVEVEGKEVKKGKKSVYLMLNKPSGCLVTLEDPFQRPTIKKFLPSLKTRVYPVGRLDFESEGLLLITNDGKLTHRLTHPRYQIKKTYLVKIKGIPQPEDISKLERGIVLDSRKTAPAKINLLKENESQSLLQVEIHEGKKREIRRMFETVGCRVMKLKRVKFDGLSLGKLKRGYWRYLTPSEVIMLKKKTGLD